jgi:diguanylate cyclase (GGDEF)-like protein
MVLSFFQFSSVVSSFLFDQNISAFTQRFTLAGIVFFLILLTQLHWEQTRYEKLSSYGLITVYFLTELVEVYYISNLFLVILTLFLLYQIRNNYRAIIKLSISLLVLLVYALVTLAAHYIGLEFVWVVSNLTLPLLLLSIFMTLQDRLMKLLMNSYIASVTDPLTGLYNKRHYQKQLQTELEQIDSEVYAIFCDIDNFKQLNDNQGHKKGDEVLIRVAEIVREEVQLFGIAARYGGEEIVAFVNLSSGDIDIKTITESIRKRVESESEVTLSIGYAKSTPSITFDQLIHKSDVAMYYSKNNGKNQVTEFFDELLH